MARQFPGKNGSLTLSAALFQGTWPGTTADATSSDHNSVHAHPKIGVAQIHTVSYPRFSRPY